MLHDTAMKAWPSVMCGKNVESGGPGTGASVRDCSLFCRWVKHVTDFGRSRERPWLCGAAPGGLFGLRRLECLCSRGACYSPAGAAPAGRGQRWRQHSLEAVDESVGLLVALKR